jgi:uncharacterized protein (TIGR03083 family)
VRRLDDPSVDPVTSDVHTYTLLTRKGEPMAKWIEAIENYSDDIATRAGGANLDLAVPSCPEWTLGDLVVHLGGVHRFWAANLLARDSGARVTPEGVDDPSDDEPIDWFRAGTTSLASALREVGDDAPCWTWWGEPLTSGAVARHQVQEAAIHNWDAKLALGIARPLASSIAHDGISEFLYVHRHELIDDTNAYITFTSTNTNGTWHVGHDSDPPVTVTGSASQLVLLLNGRAPLSALSVDGPAECVQALLDAIDLS